MQDIAARLIATATDVRKKIPDGPADIRAQKGAEMQVLRGLVGLYAACHAAETDRLMTMDINVRGQAQSMDAVWKAFDKGLVMLEVLAGSITSDENTAAATSSGGPAPVTPPAATTPVAPPPVAAAPAQEEPKVAPENQAGYNPMSFFKPPGKKSAEG